MSNEKSTREHSPSAAEEKQATERALAESEQKFRALVDASSEIVWMLDENGVLSEDSPSWTKFTGCSFREMQESGWVRVVHPDDLNRVIDSWSKARASGSGYEMEFRLRHVSGEWRWMETRAVPLTHPDGSLRGWIGMNVDITRRKEIELELQKSVSVAERARRSVENERENFRNLFRQSPEMVCILKGPDHIFEFVNEAHVRALGFDATGLSVRDAQPESVQVHGILDHVYKTGETAQLHEIPVTVTDRLRYFNLTYAARRDDNGVINGIMILGVEVTDQVLVRESLSQARQDAERNLKKLNTVVHHLSEGMVFGDANGNLLLMNSEALRIHGFGDMQSMERNLVAYPNLFELRTLEGGEVAFESWPIQRVVRGEKFHDMEIRLVRKDVATESVVSYGGTPVYDESGKLILSVLTIRDISEKKRMELALKEAIRSRDEFISIASHELKTPISSLKLQAQLLKRLRDRGDPATYSPERVNKLIDQLDRQIERVTRLVDDMLDISRIRAGKLGVHKESVAMDKLVAEVVERLGPTLIEAGAPVSFERLETLEAECDRIRIEQVVTNLLTNAMRYGDRKPIRIRLERSSQTENAVLLSVHDQGIGVAPDSCERIFNRFERAVTSSDASGLGLGLFITKQIVEIHGGRIWVESQGPGKGSSFYVELPEGSRQSSAAHRLRLR